MPFEVRHIASPPFNLEAWSIPAAAGAPPSPLILMFHGYASSKSGLLPAAQTLHQLGYPLLLLDFRKAARVFLRRQQHHHRLSRSFNDVAAAVHYAKNNLELPGQPPRPLRPIHGSAAILRAVGELKVPADAIIIESPYDRLLSTVENRFHVMNLPAFPLAQLLVFWGSVQQGYWAFDMNPAVYAANVQTPTLMFHGLLDSRITLDQAKSVFNHLAGPKHLELYQDSAHTSFLTSDPKHCGPKPSPTFSAPTPKLPFTRNSKGREV